MTKFLLIRHAAHDLLGKVLTGRAPGLHLNAQGKLEAERLADRLAVFSISAIYTGPLERARETAQPLSNRLRLELSFAPAFDEIDFGSWTMLPFSELDQRPDWKAWNEFRDRPLHLRVRPSWQYKVAPRKSWNALPRPVTERRWRSSAMEKLSKAL